jgi:hypothetical protein
MLTPDVLERLWPEASERLIGALRAQGIDAAVAEDAVSEAVTRALSRGLPVADVEDFCRWGFVVARNIAVDAIRRSQRVTPLDTMPEAADQYDMVGHAEVRERWRQTAHAMTLLTPSDRAALLATLDDEPTPTNRREAVRHAVRRHRARDRLRRVLAQPIGILAWLKRPRTPWAGWVAAYDRMSVAVVVPLFATLGSLLPAPHAHGAQVSPDAGLGASAQALALPASPPPSPVRAAAPAPARAVAVQAAPRPSPPPGPALAPTRGSGFEFAASPSYDTDHTVFATASERSTSCGRANGMCPLLYKSTDGGVSWALLPARGRDIGGVLLPPAYPRDPRIFSAGLTLSVSTDGGQSFTTVAPATGPASMSPLFSAGDSRILFGSDRALLVPAPTQYRDGVPGVTPLQLPLPKQVIPLQFWFANDFSADRRMLVLAMEAPAAAIDPGTTQAQLSVSSTSVYSCTDHDCQKVVDLGLQNMVKRAWTDRSTVFVGGTFTLHRSTDGGRSFQALALPGTAPRRMLLSMAASAGRLFATITNEGVNRLYLSEDNGVTWRLLDEHAGSFVNMLALPDGALIQGLQTAEGGIRCSVNGGVTWTESCRRL